jgi:hypothetical protein
MPITIVAPPQANAKISAALPKMLSVASKLARLFALTAALPFEVLAHMGGSIWSIEGESAGDDKSAGGGVEVAANTGGTAAIGITMSAKPVIVETAPTSEALIVSRAIVDFTLLVRGFAAGDRFSIFPGLPPPPVSPPLGLPPERLDDPPMILHVVLISGLRFSFGGLISPSSASFSFSFSFDMLLFGLMEFMRKSSQFVGAQKLTAPGAA